MTANESPSEHRTTDHSPWNPAVKPIFQWLVIHPLIHSISLQHGCKDTRADCAALIKSRYWTSTILFVRQNDSLFERSFFWDTVVKIGIFWTMITKEKVNNLNLGKYLRNPINITGTLTPKSKTKSYNGDTHLWWHGWGFVFCQNTVLSNSNPDAYLSLQSSMYSLITHREGGKKKSAVMTL